MDKIGLLECIEAVNHGDSSFKTLRGVTLVSKDSFWCYRNFVVFDVIIKDERYKLKICLDNNELSDSFYNNIDRCNTFYNDIFIETITLLDELEIHTAIKTYKRHVALIKNDHEQIIPNIQEYMNGYLELVKGIIKTNLVIDYFSLKWCIYTKGELKVTLEKGIQVLPNRLITPELLVGFRNYLVVTLQYIITNYSSKYFYDFINDAPKDRKSVV